MTEWHQTVSFYWRNDVILREVPNSRCVFERSVTCLYLDNRFSIVLIVYVLFGGIHGLCPHKHNFHSFLRWIHVSAIGLYKYCWYYAWVVHVFDGILLSAGYVLGTRSSWKIFDYYNLLVIFVAFHSSRYVGLSFMFYFSLHLYGYFKKKG